MTILCDFDAPIDRRDSQKWNTFAPDVLPCWVADMDFRSPEPVIEALTRRAQEGVFGYPESHPAALTAVLQERLLTRHGLPVQPEDIVYVPGLVCAMNIVARAIGAPGDGILVTTPIYPPFLTTPANQQRSLITAPLAEITNGSTLRYELDINALEAAITPQTRLFMFCNPQNPVGHVYSRAELDAIADFCLRHDLILCSDEIHCDLNYSEADPISIAALSPEIARRTITLLSPSKTFNVPGLGCGFMVVQNAELRARLRAASDGIVPGVNLMGYLAAHAAYRDSQSWLDELLPYLRANRDTVVDFVADNLPGIRTTRPAATYLAWLDCRNANLGPYASPFQFCLEEAKIAPSDGAAFGPGGEGFLRLNFGCTSATLLEVLQRMSAAFARFQ